MFATEPHNADDAVHVVGAGPAGLAAAITLAQAGREVVVHEAHHEVGHRFKGDFQGLENWTSNEDVLASFKGLGITTGFEHQAMRAGTAFDPWGGHHSISSDQPLFYLVERGPGPATLDTAMLDQARALGVEVRLGSRVERLGNPGVLAAGPRVADAISVGYHCRTDWSDGYWVICDDELAPKGYAYLLVWRGRATLKSCMFAGFKEERRYVERTVAAFRRLLGFEMIDPVPHGGVGNFRIPHSAYSGAHPMVGEHAGFQDTLWGFGIRLAVVSGVLAARSLLGRGRYDSSWRSLLGGQLETSVVNRAIFGLLGQRGYRVFLRHLERQACARAFLQWHYRSTLVKRLLGPWARRRYHSRRKDTSCDHVDCQCVWCRCGKET